MATALSPPHPPPPIRFTPSEHRHTHAHINMNANPRTHESIQPLQQLTNGITNTKTAVSSSANHSQMAMCCVTLDVCHSPSNSFNYPLLCISNSSAVSASPPVMTSSSPLLTPPSSQQPPPSSMQSVASSQLDEFSYHFGAHSQLPAWQLSVMWRLLQCPLCPLRRRYHAITRAALRRLATSTQGVASSPSTDMLHNRQIQFFSLQRIRKLLRSLTNAPSVASSEFCKCHARELYNTIYHDIDDVIHLRRPSSQLSSLTQQLSQQSLMQTSPHINRRNDDVIIIQKTFYTVAELRHHQMWGDLEEYADNFEVDDSDDDDYDIAGDNKRKSNDAIASHKQSTNTSGYTSLMPPDYLTHHANHVRTSNCGEKYFEFLRARFAISNKSHSDCATSKNSDTSSTSSESSTSTTESDRLRNSHSLFVTRKPADYAAAPQKSILKRAKNKQSGEESDQLEEEVENENAEKRKKKKRVCFSDEKNGSLRRLATVKNIHCHAYAMQAVRCDGRMATLIAIRNYWQNENAKEGEEQPEEDSD